MEEIGDDIDIRTNYKVQNIDYSNEEYVQITALHNGILHFIQADHVISTVSLGSTMLRKLSKCEVRGVTLLKIDHFTTTQILHEIKFWQIQTVKKCHFSQF